MNSGNLVATWLKHPFPFWDAAVSQALTGTEESPAQLADYSIAKVLTGQYNRNSLISIEAGGLSPFLELYSESLSPFYNEHGLEHLAIAPGQTGLVIKKLKSAQAVIGLMPSVYEDILRFVRTIQILKSDYPENDVSYSHPDIPYSIFLSLCEVESEISDLRVAESILHESMHLKLTLVENTIPLVKPNSDVVFYSPWRGESRPVRGVLHGLFVFRAILDFYRALQTTSFYKRNEPFLDVRISSIKSELSKLVEFADSPGLTETGKIFVARLLQNLDF
jgi:HEXXH motif-containing protein